MLSLEVLITPAPAYRQSCSNADRTKGQRRRQSSSMLLFQQFALDHIDSQLCSSNFTGWTLLRLPSSPVLLHA